MKKPLAEENTALSMASMQTPMHNIDSPIHRLPPELLMAILYEARRRLEDLRFAHVCRHWRTLLFAMPEFWASMLNHLEVSFFDVHPALLRHCLTLSSPRPIKVQVLFTWTFERELLAPHASRIVLLSVRSITAGAGHAFEALLDDGLPNLKTLCYNRQLLSDDPWQPSRPLSEFSLPALRELEIPAAFPLRTWFTPTLEHIAIHGHPDNMHDFRGALSRCTSLKYLTFRPDPSGLSATSSLGSTFTSTFPPKEKMPSLRRLSVTGSAADMVEMLTQLNIPPPAHIQLRCNDKRVDIRAVLKAPTFLADEVLPALTRLYLGRTHTKGRVRLQGYTRAQTTDKYEERLDIAMWRDWASGDALAELLRPFADSQVTALAVDLPHLPLVLERSSWGQRWGGARRSVFPPPRELRRLELLGGMPGSAKARFARWFVGEPGAERPPASELTLCWVLDVSRGREAEARADEEVTLLAQLLLEFHVTRRRLGRLELYGTLQSSVVATRVSRVRTNVERCQEVAGSFVLRAKELVDEVVLM